MSAHLSPQRKNRLEQLQKREKAKEHLVQKLRDIALKSAGVRFEESVAALKSPVF
jgi:hypothetical protein